jgi:hypothetical protein
MYNISKSNPTINILLENCHTFSDKNYLYAALESDQSYNITNTLITNLYKSALNKEHVNFEDIPESKGDITKYSGYKSMADSLVLLREIAQKSNIKIEEIEIIQQAITNLTLYKDLLFKGFQLNKDFIILQYNVLVYACVEGVSTLISSYVDFIKRPDKIDFTVIKNAKTNGWLCIDNLQKFNMCVKNGDFSKMLNTIINSGKESFLASSLLIPALVISGLMIIVPVIREIIFYFYYSRMALSEYLKQQSAFLEINKVSIQSSNLSASKKGEILRKQNESINKLMKLSDKIKIDKATTDNKVKDALKKENTNWSVKNIESQNSSTDSSGFQLL